MKRILILTASFGEGHNSAARGVRDGLARVAPEQSEVELRDLFAETYGSLNEFVRKVYLAVINRWPQSWGYVYRWLERKKDFDKSFRRFSRLKGHFATLLDRFRPDVIVSTFPPFPYLFHQISGPSPDCKNVVVITDSITVNSIWYRCVADYFLVPNEQSAAVLRTAGVPPEKIKIFGFPVSPKFADFPHIIGWTEDLPRMLHESHLLIGKAGGATVQETIAAGCPMIINHVVSGQEEGNARLIVETNSGVIAHSPAEAVAQVQRAFADDAKQWREWAANISRLSRPRASLDIAEFLLSI